MNAWLATVYEAFDWLLDRWRHEREPESVAFDALHGVDTAGWTLDYEPIRPSVCDEVLDALPAAAAGSVFMDLGCGKGRVLLIASRRPWARVCGVEVVHGLVEVCRANLASWAETHPDCGPLEVLHADAIDFAIPRSNLVLFLYNPFGGEVLRAVLDRVRRDHDGTRQVWIAYVNPLEADAIGEPWTLLSTGGSDFESWRIYSLTS